MEWNLHRGFFALTSSEEEDIGDTQKDEAADLSRRDFLKVTMTLSALLAFGGVATVLKAISNPAPPGTTGPQTFPRIKVADASLSANSPIYFNYPLDNTPNFLVKLGQPAAGGVGPNQDIVAFSQICQHLGCTSIAYQAQSTYGPVANCSCHGSIFSTLESAKVKAGPSPLPLPQVQLEVDSSGNIYAKGMGPPTIYGHTSDLQGGNIVS